MHLCPVHQAALHQSQQVLMGALQCGCCCDDVLDGWIVAGGQRQVRVDPERYDMPQSGRSTHVDNMIRR